MLHGESSPNRSEKRSEIQVYLGHIVHVFIGPGLYATSKKKDFVVNPGYRKRTLRQPSNARHKDGQRLGPSKSDLRGWLVWFHVGRV